MMTRLSTRLATAGVCLLMAACTTMQAPQAPDGTDARLHRLLYVAMDHIETYHVEPVSNEKLAVGTLSSMSKADPQLRFTHDRRGFVMQRAGVEIAAADWPQGRDTGDWADLIAMAVERARDASPQLAALSSQQLTNGIMDGLTGELARFSRYNSPQESDNERRRRNGYGGIGLSFEVVEGEHKIIEVFPDAPAFRAGVQLGDVILSVEGREAASLDPYQLAELIRGPIGSPLSLAVRRGKDVIPFEIRRAKVVPVYVTSEIRGKVGVIHLNRFTKTTHEALDRQIEEIEQRIGKPRGLIIDVRGNPGGLLDQAVDVIDLFVSRGDLSSAKGRHPGSIQHFTAGWGSIADNVPIIVLVDGRSASAAEILAAGLQDNGRAIVAGSSSFGKGSVQRVFSMPDGGELLITWSYIYTPSGRRLDLSGVVPELCFSGLNGTTPQLVSRVLARSGPGMPPMDRQSCPPQDALPAGTLDALVDMLNDPASMPPTLSAALPTPPRRRQIAE